MRSAYLLMGAAPGAAEAIELGNLRIEYLSRQAQLEGHAVSLTRVEFDLLLFLAQRAGRVCSRRELLAALWATTAPEVETRSLDTHISTLRRKLRGMNPHRILTVRQRGYGLLVE